MYTLTHTGYCGMRTMHEMYDELSEARQAVAEYLREARRDYVATTLVPGSEWEILEPADCLLVPDECGMLILEHRTFECCECGSEWEEPEGADKCCDDLSV